ncbi:hypothetical protein LMHCC_1273 [Listeria monocytogenes HCC23]|uniref:Uncharacterized protein n=1 Tax=Listeria monocytogenes serotype 4a (strain M7) TaxID=1030009 RepID=A0A0E0UVB6_LISMM|nr:hypothetical protein LMHCC_1273 [Listeria monocytogenes HCC23]AEH92387.1 hypothetical protein LMM7_1382 [Listeria monocytogenes M7]
MNTSKLQLLEQSKKYYKKVTFICKKIFLIFTAMVLIAVFLCGMHWYTTD